MYMKCTTKLQTGSVLLEALISILIFSIGILALIGMQATAINGVADSKYRSTASFLTDQMLGTIWATRLGSTIPNASNVMASSPDPSFGCNPCNASAGNGNAYTQVWAGSSVAAALPNATASILVNGPVVTVSVGWTPPRETVAHKHVAVTFIN